MQKCKLECQAAPPDAAKNTKDTDADTAVEAGGRVALLIVCSFLGVAVRFHLTGQPPTDR